MHFCVVMQFLAIVACVGFYMMLESKEVRRTLTLTLMMMKLYSSEIVTQECVIWCESQLASSSCFPLGQDVQSCFVWIGRVSS